MNIFNDGKVSVHESGEVEVTTPVKRWSYAAGISIESADFEDESIVGVGVLISVKVRSGAVGIGCVNADGSLFLSEERHIEQ